VPKIIRSRATHHTHRSIFAHSLSVAHGPVRSLPMPCSCCQRSNHWASRPLCSRAVDQQTWSSNFPARFPQQRAVPAGSATPRRVPWGGGPAERTMRRPPLQRKHGKEDVTA
jgi:hypothetical protein